MPPSASTLKKLMVSIAIAIKPKISGVRKAASPNFALTETARALATPAVFQLKPLITEPKKLSAMRPSGLSAFISFLSACHSLPLRRVTAQVLLASISAKLYASIMSLSEKLATIKS